MSDSFFTLCFFSFVCFDSSVAIRHVCRITAHHTCVDERKENKYKVVTSTFRRHWKILSREWCSFIQLVACDVIPRVANTVCVSTKSEWYVAKCKHSIISCQHCQSWRIMVSAFGVFEHWHVLDAAIVVDPFTENYPPEPLSMKTTGHSAVSRSHTCVCVCVCVYLCVRPYVDGCFASFKKTYLSGSVHVTDGGTSHCRCLSLLPHHLHELFFFYGRTLSPFEAAGIPASSLP